MCSMSDRDFDQRAVFGVLNDEHPRLLELDELRVELTGVDVELAVALLVNDGVATRLGGRVGLTRAAVRAGQLTT